VKRNLFLKILFSYLVIVSLSFFVLDLLIKDEIKKVLTAKIETELLAYAELIDLSSAKEMSEQLKQIARISGARVTLVDDQGKVFADSEKDIASLENHLNRPEVQEARLRGKGNSIRYSQSIGVDMLYVAITMKSKSQNAGYVRLARPLHDVQNAIEQVYQSIFLTMMIAAVIALIIALVFSYRLAAPIRALEKFTERLRQGQKEGAIFLQTSDETKTLADNINYLVAELQSQVSLAREEQSKLMAALTSMTEGVLILNAENKIEFISPVLNKMLADQYGDVTGRTLLESFRNVELQKAFLEFQENRQLINREVTLGDITPVILSVSISPVQGEPGEEKAMVVFHDLTRLKKLEQIRTDFVVNVTHEMKTPLTAIIGYLETIQGGAINNIEDTKKFIDIILRQSQRLNRLVEDLMIISKLELGEINLQFENVSINEALNGALPVVAVKAEAKKIAVENNIAGNLPQVFADFDRLTQILVNILDNAVKFTPDSGKITIDAKHDNGYVVVSISDTGVGVPKEEVQRLGERFYRVDRDRSRELGGTGLGLSIVKHLMIAQRGKMEIESQLGQGTKVSLFFPIQ
jgi:two-component system phosphate regulon sensor histidine kinase PhoR